MTTQSHKSTFITDVKRFIALFLWLGSIHLNIFVILFLVCNLPRGWAISLLLVWVSLAFVPIRGNSPFGNSLAQFICRYGASHFPIKAVLDEKSAIKEDQAYVLGVEPHSIFYVPILRHVWSWMTLAPASRHMLKKLLRDGHSVAIIPGGVQECLYMRHGREVAFLSKRLGFVRVAMQTGAPLVPIFCFGQTEVYHWWMPRGEWYKRLSRAIGFAPLLFWGMWGSFIPFRKPIYVVIGRPIPVETIEDPTKEQVQELLSKFIRAMRDLFERHKEAAGYPALALDII